MFQGISSQLRLGEMQLRLLANVPSVSQMPLRDARGRRRSTCISSSELVEAGLSALIAGGATVAAAASEEPEAKTAPDEDEEEDAAQNDEQEARDDSSESSKE